MFFLNNIFCGDLRIQFLRRQLEFNSGSSSTAPYWIKISLLSIVESMDMDFIRTHDDAAVFDLLTEAAIRTRAKKFLSLVELCRIVDFIIADHETGNHIEAELSIWKFLEAAASICMTQSDGETYWTKTAKFLETMERLHTTILVIPDDTIFRCAMSCLYTIHCEYTLSHGPPPSLTPFLPLVVDRIAVEQRRDLSFIGTRMSARLYVS